jgi:hypothetical protein
MEPWSDIGVARALVTPVEDASFHRAQPRRRRNALSTARELAHLDDAVNEFWASPEPLRDIADGYFLLHEALDSAFDRAEVLDVNHALRPASVGKGSPLQPQRPDVRIEINRLERPVHRYSPVTVRLYSPCTL